MTARLAAVLPVAVALAPLQARATSGGDGGIGDLVPPALNLALLLGVLYFLARKPIQTWFRERRDRIQGEVESAAELQRRAEERYARWQRRLADVEQELEQVRATSRERAVAEGERILADAQASAERIRKDARVAVEQELRRARKQLREEASDLALALAGGLLREQVDDGDRDRLLDEFIEDVERAAGNGHGNGR